MIDVMPVKPVASRGYLVYFIPPGDCLVFVGDSERLPTLYQASVGCGRNKDWSGLAKTALSLRVGLGHLLRIANKV